MVSSLCTFCVNNTFTNIFSDETNNNLEKDTVEEAKEKFKKEKKEKDKQDKKRKMTKIEESSEPESVFKLV